MLQKRCHSPQPPCLGDLSKPAHFISSVAPTLMRNAISIFPTCSFTPKKLPKEQGNRCSRWCTQGQSWVPKTSFSLVKKRAQQKKKSVERHSALLLVFHMKLIHSAKHFAPRLSSLELIHSKSCFIQGRKDGQTQGSPFSFPLSCSGLAGSS